MNRMSDPNPYSSPVHKERPFVCRNCGYKLFERVKPESGIAFAKDYQCRQCKEQIPAPVPLWGALLMLVLGVVIFLVGASGLLASIYYGFVFRACYSAAIAILGARFARSGLSSLSK